MIHEAAESRGMICLAKEVIVSDDRITGDRQPCFGLTPAERRQGIMSTPPASEPIAPLTEETARSVFLAWEKLRIAFNAILAAVVLLSAGSAISEGAFWRFLVWGALGANLCFCLGPVVEGYLSLLGSNRQAARWVVFSLGVMAGCFLTFGAVFSWQMQGFD
jgi:hypothetical protein